MGDPDHRLSLQPQTLTRYALATSLRLCSD